MSGLGECEPPIIIDYIRDSGRTQEIVVRKPLRGLKNQQFVAEQTPKSSFR
jgi:hypothetical protein